MLFLLKRRRYEKLFLDPDTSRAHRFIQILEEVQRIGPRGQKKLVAVALKFVRRQATEDDLNVLMENANASK